MPLTVNHSPVPGVHSLLRIFCSAETVILSLAHDSHEARLHIGEALITALPMLCSLSISRQAVWGPGPECSCWLQLSLAGWLSG